MAQTAPVYDVGGESLLKMVKGLITPQMVQRAADVTSESTDKIQSGLRVTVPAILSAVVNKGSTEAGARDMMRLLQSGDPTTDPTAGRNFLSTILEGSAGRLTDTIVKFSGLKHTSVVSLFGMVGPLIMKVLGDKVRMSGFNETSLMNYLGDQKDSIRAALPTGFKMPFPPKANWATPLAIIGGLLVLLAVVWGLRADRPVTEVVPPVTPPAAEMLPPSGGDLVLEELRFYSGSAEPIPESLSGVDRMAESLRANPTARIRIDGHTDNIGNAIANRDLSLNRADRVKAMLVERGIDSDRIETEGFGQERPMASNDTPEGRQENRRIEITILSR